MLCPELERIDWAHHHGTACQMQGNKEAGTMKEKETVMDSCYKMIGEGFAGFEQFKV